MIPTELILIPIAWLLGFWLLWHIRTCDEDGARLQPPTPSTPKLPTVSVIIPARDEELSLPNLLSSLAAQPCQADEVIVVDDRSSDRTAEIARDAGAVVISAGDLPADWNGKSWACWAGAKAATSDLLVFLDADTTLAPDGLARLRAEYSRGGGLLSVQPFHIALRPYERLAAIFNIMLMMGMNVFSVLGTRVKPTGAFGPCMVCRREDYFDIGGHQAVRGEILEDCFIGKSFARSGRDVRCLAGLGTVTFRMYPAGFGQMVEGWTKTFGGGGGSTNYATALMVSAWLIGATAAVVVPIWGLVEGNLPLIAAGVLVYTGYALQLRWMWRSIGDFGRWTAFLYPAPLLFIGYIAALAAITVWITGKVRWKGRSLATRPLSAAAWDK